LRWWPRRLRALLLGRVGTLLLAAIALALGIATFSVLSGGLTLARRPHVEIVLFGANLLALALLGLALIVRLAKVLGERRRGLAGSRLHVRLVLLFGVVAVVPTTVVAVFAAAFFHLGIQLWFNDRVRTALDEALQASTGYLQEHNNNIRADALAMANDLSQNGAVFYLSQTDLQRLLAEQMYVRGLSEAAIFDPNNNQVLASHGLLNGLGVTLPPPAATMLARSGDVAIQDSPDGHTVSAVVGLGDASPPNLMLVITRPVDPVILDHMRKTQSVVADYNRLDHNRSGLQITFVMIFALVALLVLAAAVLVGLVLANQIARPVGLLILAAERVREGDLGVRVPEAEREDEVAGLSRAFNRMTDQLSAQRGELMAAYSQINERRRFTEAVLSGVSAGVVGLDAEQRVELPNRAAGVLLGFDLMGAVGQSLAELVPEFAPLLALARLNPERPQTAEIQSGRRTLLVRIGPEMRGAVTEGYVVTFDDITELQSAQRKAAWADVARRIAHEIKNPLTPIQLSAERLKRRFLREIQSDPDTFSQCADTIVRHVGDIGRMVDEFSAFARMPHPQIKPEDLSRIVREALILQKSAHPEVRFVTDLPDRGPVVPCDRRLIGQALTNLLQNAADGIGMRPAEENEAGARPAGPGGTAAGTLVSALRGTIWIALRSGDREVSISVADDGIGLPDADRQRLTEPYVTHKPKGTGLGLAIVKKIMEDHGGSVTLDDRAEGRGAIATLSLPAPIDKGGARGDDDGA
jgi:two-component system, NtrC family, nitrogen regulation sensor histidine kinase NtrY